MAGALDVRLSGPRAYDNHMSDEPWVNGLAPDPSALDVARVDLDAAAILLDVDTTQDYETLCSQE